MTTTSPDGIPLIDPGDTIGGYRVGYNAQSNALQTALVNLRTGLQADDSVATIAGLAGLDTWSGRVVFVEEDESVRVWTGAAWAVVSGYAGSRIYGEERRTGTGNFSAGSMAWLASLTITDAAPGIWRVLFAPLVSCSLTANLFVRGSIAGVGSTFDEQFTINANRRVFPIEVYTTHTSGDLELELEVQVSNGTGSAPEGSRITASRIGPA